MAGTAAAPTQASADPGCPAAAEATGAFRVVDRRAQQRLLVSTTKPPIIIGGRTYPAKTRQGPPEGTYLIFNDEDGSEKGGIVASRATTSISLDYSNAQAITLASRWEDQQGAAVLFMRQMPDPTLPVGQVPATPDRVQLGYSTSDGSFLALNDSAGQTRIMLSVDAEDKPSITIFNTDGTVATRLPN